MDSHDWETPGRSGTPDLPAKVPRRWVGPEPGSAPAPDPEVKREYKKDPAWDKLLLLAAGIAVVLAVLVVPGILNPGGENPVAEAAQATIEWPGARMSFTATAIGDDGTVTMRGSGVMNGETNRALIDITAVASQSNGGRTYRASQIDDGTDAYFRSPELSQSIGEGSPWLLIRSDAFGDLAQEGGGGGFMKVGGASSPSGPREELNLLQDASSDVRSVGREQVRGVTTTRYTGTIDFAKLLDKYRDDLSDEASDLMDQALQQNPTATVDVWIDDQGLIRRESATGDFSSASASQTVEFYDFGIHPQIDVPPSSQVHDVTPLLQEALEPFLKD